MDNAIRAALDLWLPLIKGLSFDERVGFLAAITKDLPIASLNGYSHASDPVTRCGYFHAKLIEIQNEQLKALDARREPPPPSVQIKAQNTLSQHMQSLQAHATKEQLIQVINKAITRAGYGDTQAALDIQRYAKQLERIIKDETANPHQH